MFEQDSKPLACILKIAEELPYLSKECMECVGLALQNDKFLIRSLLEYPELLKAVEKNFRSSGESEL